LPSGSSATVHGVAAKELHFREFGTLDALVDVVGTRAALEELEIVAAVGSPVALGSGLTRSAPGVLPVPGAPALHGRADDAWLTPIPMRKDRTATHCPSSWCRRRSSAREAQWTWTPRIAWRRPEAGARQTQKQPEQTCDDRYDRTAALRIFIG
jgi:hypothetical protein